MEEQLTCRKLNQEKNQCVTYLQSLVVMTSVKIFDKLTPMF